MSENESNAEIKFGKNESDAFFDMCVRQGYVPITCLLPGVMVYSLTTNQGNACIGCNHDRNICKGRSRERS